MVSWTTSNMHNGIMLWFHVAMWSQAWLKDEVTQAYTLTIFIADDWWCTCWREHTCACACSTSPGQTVEWKNWYVCLTSLKQSVQTHLRAYPWAIHYCVFLLHKKRRKYRTDAHGLPLLDKSRLQHRNLSTARQKSTKSISCRTILHCWCCARHPSLHSTILGSTVNV